MLPPPGAACWVLSLLLQPVLRQSDDGRGRETKWEGRAMAFMAMAGINEGLMSFKGVAAFLYWRRVLLCFLLWGLIPCWSLFRFQWLLVVRVRGLGLPRGGSHSFCTQHSHWQCYSHLTSSVDESNNVELVAPIIRRTVLYTIPLGRVIPSTCKSRN